MEYTSKDPGADAPQSSAWKKWAVSGVLFAAGLILGLALFFPRDVFWDLLLYAADRRFEEVDISRQGLSHPEWGRALVHGLQIDHRGHAFVVPKAELVLGVDPWLQANVHTGPKMVIMFPGGKQIFARGEVDLSKITAPGTLRGSISTQAMIRFQDWEHPPVEGNIQLNSTSPIKVHENLFLQGIIMQATWQGNRCQIHSLQAEKPVRFSGTGQIQLIWTEILDSQYQVQGSVISKGQDIPFERQGRLRDMWP